ncbi:MAG: helix-turn-helix domain-containing protein [Nocardioides sp.]
MSDDATQALRATAHPLRLQMLSLLTGAEMSAAEVARELDLTHANASYHLRLLLDAGQLEVASEERIRGGVAKRYRHHWRDHPTRGRSSSAGRLAWARAMSAELVRRVGQYAGRPGSFTDAELWVSEEDYLAVRASLLEASNRLHATAQPPRTEGTIKVAMTAALFEMRPS